MYMTLTGAHTKSCTGRNSILLMQNEPLSCQPNPLVNQFSQSNPQQNNSIKGQGCITIMSFSVRQYSVLCESQSGRKKPFMLLTSAIKSLKTSATSSAWALDQVSKLCLPLWLTTIRFQGRSRTCHRQRQLNKLFSCYVQIHLYLLRKL